MARPKLPDSAKKLKNFTFRGTSELHESLRKAAQENGHSVSDEIGERLTRSFDPDLDVDQLFGTRAEFALTRLLYIVMAGAGREAAALKKWKPDLWMRDPYAFSQAFHAADSLLEKFLNRLGDIGSARPITPITGDMSPDDAHKTQIRNDHVKNVWFHHMQSAMSLLHLEESHIGKRLRSDMDPVLLSGSGGEK
jgi:hypothetical protein